MKVQVSGTRVRIFIVELFHSFLYDPLIQFNTAGQSHSALFSPRPIGAELVRLRHRATRSFQNGAGKYYGLVRNLQMFIFSRSCRPGSGSHEEIIHNYSPGELADFDLEEMSPLTGLINDR